MTAATPNEPPNSSIAAGTKGTPVAPSDIGFAPPTPFAGAAAPLGDLARQQLHRMRAHQLQRICTQQHRNMIQVQALSLTTLPTHASNASVIPTDKVNDVERALASSNVAFAKEVADLTDTVDVLRADNARLVTYTAAVKKTNAELRRKITALVADVEDLRRTLGYRGFDEMRGLGEGKDCRGGPGSAEILGERSSFTSLIAGAELDRSTIPV